MDCPPPPPTATPRRAARSRSARRLLCALAWLSSLGLLPPAQAAGDPAAAPAATPVDPPAVRLSPRVRGQALPPAPAPGLPADQVLPFLRGLRILEPQALAQAARIVGGPAGHDLIAAGDPAYARGLAGAPLRRGDLPPGTLLAVVRPARALTDPDTREVLGHETRQVALARILEDEGDSTAARLDIRDAIEELQPGDRLLPAQEADPPAYLPRPPQQPVHGRIVSVDRRGAVMAGTRDGVVVGLGHRDGLEPGHLLSAFRRRSDPGAGAAAASPHPAAERIGLLMVVRVHERLAQALVLQASDGLRVGDAVAGADPLSGAAP